MQIPRGKAWDFLIATLIAEVSRLIRLFNSGKGWEPVAKYMLQVFLPLLLQKPSHKSKNREHIKYLNKRMEWWKHGKPEELISECEAIQKRLKISQNQKTIRPKSFLQINVTRSVEKGP